MVLVFVVEVYAGGVVLAVVVVVLMFVLMPVRLHGSIPLSQQDLVEAHPRCQPIDDFFPRTHIYQVYGVIHTPIQVPSARPLHKQRRKTSPLDIQWILHCSYHQYLVYVSNLHKIL